MTFVEKWSGADLLYVRIAVQRAFDEGLGDYSQALRDRVCVVFLSCEVLYLVVVALSCLVSKYPCKCKSKVMCLTRFLIDWLRDCFVFVCFCCCCCWGHCILSVACSSPGLSAPGVAVGNPADCHSLVHHRPADLQDGHPAVLQLPMHMAPPEAAVCARLFRIDSIENFASIPGRQRGASMFDLFSVV